MGQRVIGENKWLWNKSKRRQRRLSKKRAGSEGELFGHEENQLERAVENETSL